MIKSIICDHWMNRRLTPPTPLTHPNQTTSADSSAYTTMFKCDGSECKQTKDPKTGRVQTLCPSAHCNMTCEVGGPDEACSEFVAGQIAQIGQKGPLSMLCDDPLAPGVERDGTACIVHEDLLDFYFQGVQLDQVRALCTRLRMCCVA